MRTVRRSLACSVLAVFCGVTLTATPPVTATPAQMVRDIWEPSDANAPDAGPTQCMHKDVVLAAGNYLWEGHARLLDRTTGGDYDSIDRVQRIIYLRAGTYRWATCLGALAAHCDENDECTYAWWHANTLTDHATDVPVHNDDWVHDGNNEYITRFGRQPVAVLHRAGLLT
jgi:hypothetical protein